MQTYTRQEARLFAAEAGLRYRITKAGEVHFYGAMPNSNKYGWWFAGYAA